MPRMDLASKRHFYLAGLGGYWITGVALAGPDALELAPRWIGLMAALALAGALFTARRKLIALERRARVRSESVPQPPSPLPLSPP